jgi:hypothetical protein
MIDHQPAASERRTPEVRAGMRMPGLSSVMSLATMLGPEGGRVELRGRSAQRMNVKQSGKDRAQ